MDFDKKWLALGLVLLLLSFAGGAKYESFKYAQRQAAVNLVQSGDREEGRKTGAAPAKEIITVYVIGEVKRPGIYRLLKGNRVYQAVEMAGGTLATADMKHADMARKLTDEETVYIAALGEITPSTANGVMGSTPTGTIGNSSGPAKAGLVNINTASAEELDTLDGIGPALAQRIIDYRSANGPFARVEDINNVSGIGDKKLEAIKNSITVR